MTAFEPTLDLDVGLLHWTPCPVRLLRDFVQAPPDRVLLAGMQLALHLVTLRARKDGDRKSVRDLSGLLSVCPSLPVVSRRRAHDVQRYAQVFAGAWEALKGKRGAARATAIHELLQTLEEKHRIALERDLSAWVAVPDALLDDLLDLKRPSALLAALYRLLLFAVALYAEYRHRQMSARELAAHVPGASKQRACEAQAEVAPWAARWGYDLVPQPPRMGAGAAQTAARATGAGRTDPAHPSTTARAQPGHNPDTGNGLQGVFLPGVGTEADHKRDGSGTEAGRSRARSTQQTQQHSPPQRRSKKPCGKPPAKRPDPASNRASKKAMTGSGSSSAGVQADPPDPTLREREEVLVECWEKAFEAVTGEWEVRHPSRDAACRIRSIAQRSTLDREGLTLTAFAAGYRALFQEYLRLQRSGHAFPDPKEASSPHIGHALAWLDDHLSRVQRVLLYHRLSEEHGADRAAEEVAAIYAQRADERASRLMEGSW